MLHLDTWLAGEDLRSLGNTGPVLAKIKTQHDFDELFTLLFHRDRIVTMRAADAIEKISISRPFFLFKYKKQILALCEAAKNKELKWHLALLLPRLPFTNKEFNKAWLILLRWAKDNTNSRIVRVNTIQALFEMSCHIPAKKKELNLLLPELEKENIPSLNARIRKIRKELDLNKTPGQVTSINPLRHVSE